MTANEPGIGEAAPLSRRQVRELERRRALEESGQDPDAPDAAWLSDEREGERAGFAAPVGVDVGAAGGATATGRTDLGYEEFTRELQLDRMLTRRELRALYEAREAQRTESAEGAPATAEAGSEVARSENAAGEAERIEAEHEAVLVEPVSDEVPGEEPEDALGGQDPEFEATPEAEADAETIEAELLEPASTRSGARFDDFADPEDAEGLDEIPVVPYAAIPFRPASASRTSLESPVAASAEAELSPAEHWSSAEVDPAISTSTIVLPPMADSADGRGAAAVTGEVMVTGTIDLPQGLAPTGGEPGRYDSSEIDRLLDAADGEGEIESGAAPVRASRAVGSLGLDKSVLKAPRRRISLPVVLASTGGVLIVGVGTLLVVALGIR